MPSFQPYVQRASERPTTISAPPSMASAINERLSGSKEPVNRDVQMRRYQRWFFYGLLVVVFLSGLGLLLKTYADNTSLIANNEALSTQVKERDRSLEEIRTQLAEKNQAAEASSSSVEEVNRKLNANLKSLEEALSKNKDLETELSKQGAAVEEKAISLERAKANTLNLVLKIGKLLPNNEIAKIKMSNIGFHGLDTDKDGLPDDVEKSFGTDMLKADTDNDNYGDWEEISGGFNPLGAGNLTIDVKLAQKYEGQIILNRQGDIYYGWYVSGDRQRYYLGSSQDKFEALRNNSYWTKGAEEKPVTPPVSIPVPAVPTTTTATE